ncbi:hypothetical protein SNE40_016780 [Patella caerulea]|uniref:Uncharacterized protein n=1 Tax=Patella caerulea TaxID=87958 RepID=A0AAN8JCJ4_PATCE
MENDSEIDSGEFTLVKGQMNGLCEIEKHCWFDDTKCQKTSGGSSLGESSLSSSNGSSCDNLPRDTLLSSTSDIEDESLLFGYGPHTKCKTRINNEQNTCGVRDSDEKTNRQVIHVLVSDINKDLTMDDRGEGIGGPIKTRTRDFSSPSLKRTESSEYTNDNYNQVKVVNKDSTVELKEVNNFQSMEALRKGFAGLGLLQKESSDYTNDGSDQVETTLIMKEKPPFPTEECDILYRKLREQLQLVDETRGPHPVHPYRTAGHHQPTNVNLRTNRGRNTHLPNQYIYNTQLETDDVGRPYILPNHMNSTESFGTQLSCPRGPPDNELPFELPGPEIVDEFITKYCPTSNNLSRSVGVTLPDNPKGIPLPSIQSFVPRNIQHCHFTDNGSGLSTLMPNHYTLYPENVQGPPICSDNGYKTCSDSSNFALTNNMTNAYYNPAMLANNRSGHGQLKKDLPVSHTNSPVNQKSLSRNFSMQSIYNTHRNHEHPMGNISNITPGRTRSGSTSSQSSSSTYQSSIRSPGYPNSDQSTAEMSPPSTASSHGYPNSDQSTAEMSPLSISSSHGSPASLCDSDPNSPPSFYNRHNPSIDTRTPPLIKNIPVPVHLLNIPTLNDSLTCTEEKDVEDESDYTESRSILIEDESDTESDPDDGNNPLHDLSYVTEPIERNSIINQQNCCPDFRKNIDAQNNSKQTPLYLAVKCQNKDVCEYLLSKQADPRILCFRKDVRKIERSFFENTLHLASEKGYYEIVEMLLKYYQEPDFIDSRRKGDGMTPLLLAIAEHSSARRNRSTIIRILVENGANLSIKDNKTGSLPLMLATKKHELKLVLEMLDNLDVGERREQVLETDRSGNTYLHMAAQINNHNTTEDLVSISDSDIQDFCMRIVQYGGDIEAKNIEGLMPKDLRHNLMRQIR